MKKLVLVVTMILCTAVFLSADFYIKQQVKTGAFMGQPAKELVQEQWFDYNRIAHISQENAFVLNLLEKKFILINHGAKTYIETKLPLDMAAIFPEQMASMMKSMMEGMTIAVAANGQTKKVLNWNCTGYDVKMTIMGMEMKMIFWATTDVPFDWKKLANLSGEMYKAQLRVGDKFVGEFKKIVGYPVATDIETMGMKITTTTLEISEKTPNPAIYEAPAGYVKKDKMDMVDMKK